MRTNNIKRFIYLSTFVTLLLPTSEFIITLVSTPVQTTAPYMYLTFFKRDALKIKCLLKSAYLFYNSSSKIYPSKEYKKAFGIMQLISARNYYKSLSLFNKSYVSFTAHLAFKFFSQSKLLVSIKHYPFSVQEYNTVMSAGIISSDYIFKMSPTTT